MSKVVEQFDGYKNIDIRLPGPKVDIEVDDLQHATTKEQPLRDIKREYFSYKNGGFITLHVPNINQAKTDKKIDEEVYKLYGLTEEEIKIVEGKK